MARARRATGSGTSAQASSDDGTFTCPECGKDLHARRLARRPSQPRPWNQRCVIPAQPPRLERRQRRRDSPQEHSRTRAPGFSGCERAARQP